MSHVHPPRRWVQLGMLAALSCVGSGAMAACSLDTAPILMDNYNALGPAPLPNNVSFSLRCDANTAVQVQASAGNSGTFDSRQLRQGAEAIAYNLYVGSTATSVWGDGTVNTAVVQAMVGANTPVQLVGNVRVAAGQNPPTGFYSDVLLFSVIY